MEPQIGNHSLLMILPAAGQRTDRQRLRFHRFGTQDGVAPDR